MIEVIWDWIIALYLFLAGLGAGAFVLSCLIGWKSATNTKLKTVGLLIALLAVAIGKIGRAHV